MFVAFTVTINIVSNNYIFKPFENLKDKLETLSDTDPLTGVNNRRYFMKSAAMQIERLKRNNNESFVMLLDLDHFKQVNDNYGHQSGDIVLKEVASRVTATLRPYDLFARYGGEEFIIFVAELDEKSLIALAERIRIEISNTPILAEGNTLSVTASLGVSLATPINNLDDAIALADKALYKAKNEGRNRVVF